MRRRISGVSPLLTPNPFQVKPGLRAKPVGKLNFLARAPAINHERMGETRLIFPQ